MNIMASAPTSTYNWSFQAIPAAFLYGIIPHSFYLVRLMQATKGQISNAQYVSPRWQLMTAANHITGHGRTLTLGKASSRQKYGTN